MPGVYDYADLLTTLAERGFVINANSCISVRNRNIVCDKCVNVCVSGCISRDERRLLVDPTRCVHCGSCATACPTGAIGLKNPGDKQLTDEAAKVLAHNKEVVVFACNSIMEKAKGRIDAETMVAVPCLGRVDESILATCAGLGAKRIVLVSDTCSECGFAKGSGLVEPVAQCAQSLFDAWGISSRIKLSEGKFPRICALAPEESYDCQRRAFFTTVKDEVKSGSVEAVNFALEHNTEDKDAPPAYEHVEADGTLPHRLPRRRGLLFDALDLASRQAHPGEETVFPTAGSKVSGRLFGRIHINPATCNGCQMCAVFCPTAALAKQIEIDHEAVARTAKMYRAPGNPRLETKKNSETAQPSSGAKPTKGPVKSVTLLHAPERCVNCGACVQICPKHAITIEHRLEATDLRAGFTDALLLKDISKEKGGPDAIKNSMSKLINSAYIWG